MSMFNKRGLIRSRELDERKIYTCNVRLLEDPLNQNQPWSRPRDLSPRLVPSTFRREMFKNPHLSQIS